MKAMAPAGARITVAGARSEVVDYLPRLLEVAVEVANEAEQAVETPACRLAQGQLGEEATSALAEQVGVLALDPLPGE